MSGLRSVTLGTSDLSKTKDLFENILGFNSSKKGENALRFGDANLSPGTRIHFVEVPKSNYQNLHIDSVGLRTPSDSGLDEYQSILPIIKCLIAQLLNSMVISTLTSMIIINNYLISIQMNIIQAFH